MAGATISPDGVFRYDLWRYWGEGPRGYATFLMLNPSTATGTADDPTIRKCVGFAKRWQRDGIRVVNLFALRSTNPRGLLDVADPVGPDNDGYLVAALRRSDLTICAWGACGNAAVKRLVAGRVDALSEKLHAAYYPLRCLGVAKDGSPRHPLMLAYDTRREQWSAP